MTTGGWSGTAYRALLRMLPSDFRVRHGRELEEAFLEMLRETAGPVERICTWIGAVIDVGQSAWSLRVGRLSRERIDDDDGRGGMMLDAWMQDTRYARHQISQRPGFAAANPG